MTPSIYTHLIAAGAALTIGASGAWWVQGQRHGLQIEQLEHKAPSADLNRANKTVADIASFQKGLNDALATFQGTQQRNASAARDLDRTLFELQGCLETLPSFQAESSTLPAVPSRSTPTSAQPYSKAWQIEVDDWRNAVQTSREKLMAIPLTPD